MVLRLHEPLQGNRMTNTQTLIAEIYSALTAEHLVSESVSWPKASEGGRVIGKEEIRAYWSRQWKNLILMSNRWR